MTNKEIIAQIRAEIERGGETFRGADFLAAHLLTFLDTLAVEETLTLEDVQRIIELDKEFQPLLEDAGIRCYRVAAKFNAEKMGI